MTTGLWVLVGVFALIGFLVLRKNTKKVKGEKEVQPDLFANEGGQGGKGGPSEK